MRQTSAKFIPNLTINDFEILEDGVPRKITNLALTLGNRVMSLSLRLRYNPTYTIKRQ